MSKYHAVPVVIDNVRFDSTREGGRYRELKLLQQVGQLSHLTWQTPYTLAVNGIVLGKYLADFTYHDRNGLLVVEDVKGMPTQLYKWKKRHVEAQYGVQIVEV